MFEKSVLALLAVLMSDAVGNLLKTVGFVIPIIKNTIM